MDELEDDSGLSQRVETSMKTMDAIYAIFSCMWSWLYSGKLGGGEENICLVLKINEESNEANVSPENERTVAVRVSFGKAEKKRIWIIYQKRKKIWVVSLNWVSKFTHKTHVYGWVTTY